jgi:hypothetical protein
MVVPPEATSNVELPPMGVPPAAVPPMAVINDEVPPACVATVAGLDIDEPPRFCRPTVEFGPAFVLPPLPLPVGPESSSTTPPQAIRSKGIGTQHNELLMSVNGWCAMDPDLQAYQERLLGRNHGLAGDQNAR